MEDYTELGAVAWDLFSGTEPGPDHPFFEDAIRRHGGPALDVGCGTGRLLLPFLRAGLDIDGIEPSPDMLAICRRKAEEQGLTPALYRQTVQTLDVPCTYRTIIVPCGTIQLVVDREEAFEALRRLHAHLDPGGLLVLTLYNRWHAMEHEQVGEWTFRAREPLPDGSEVAKHARVDARHLIEQTLDVTVRYQRLRDGQVVEEQLVPAPERWYFVHELTLMLERTGFHVDRVTGDYTDEPPRDHHFVLAFFATT